MIRSAVGHGKLKENVMSYAIIGFGKIGRAIAKAFTRKGIEVSVATTRAPGSFTADAPRSDRKSRRWQ
jgi:predicted dinucleotide-binding enzyme